MSTISTKISDLKGLDYITEVATPDLVVEGYGEDIKKEDVGDYVTQVGIASTLTSQFKESEIKESEIKGSEPEINESEIKEPEEEAPKDEVVEESPEVIEEIKDEPSTTEEEIVVDETTSTSDDTIE